MTKKYTAYSQEEITLMLNKLLIEKAPAPEVAKLTGRTTASIYAIKALYSQFSIGQVTDRNGKNAPLWKLFTGYQNAGHMPETGMVAHHEEAPSELTVEGLAAQMEALFDKSKGVMAEIVAKSVARKVAAHMQELEELRAYKKETEEEIDALREFRKKAKESNFYSILRGKLPGGQ